MSGQDLENKKNATILREHILRCFTIDTAAIIKSNVPMPDYDYFLGTILENNTEVMIVNDIKYGFAVKCMNKPRDMLVFGLKWIEI